MSWWRWIGGVAKRAAQAGGRAATCAAACLVTLGLAAGALAQPAPPTQSTPAPPPQPSATTSPPPCGTPPADRDAKPDGRDRGVLWKIERGGRSSHLYATLHYGRPAWGELGPRLREVLRDSDLLAVELDATDPALASNFVRALPTLPEPPAALNERMARVARSHCGDPAQYAALPPLLRAVSVALLPALREGLVPQLGSEHLLIRLAREQKKPVISLEDAATQAQAMSPEPPSEFPQHVATMLDQIESGSDRRVLLRLLSAWEQGNAADLAAYPSWCECLDHERDRLWHARINDERNGPLANRIEALHAGGQRALVAVGALHMSGPESLPLLLARRGFTVQQIPLN